MAINQRQIKSFHETDLAAAKAVTNFRKGELCYVESLETIYEYEPSGFSGDDTEVIAITSGGYLVGRAGKYQYGGSSSSGVSGAIQFSDGSGGFSSDDTNFHWDDTNNRIGIGTNTPSQPLHIYKNDTETSAFINVEQAGSGDSLITFTRSTSPWSIGVDVSTFKIAYGSSLSSSVFEANINKRMGINITPTTAAVNIYPNSPFDDILRLTGRTSFSGDYIRILDNSSNPIFRIEDDSSIHHGVSSTRGFNKRIQKDITNVTSWATVATLGFNTTTNVYTAFSVRVKASGHTNTQGSGMIETVKGGTIDNAAPSLAAPGTDLTIGAAAPQVQLVVSGNSVLVQVQSSDGTNTMNGSVFLEFFCPRDNSAIIQWSIS